MRIGSGERSFNRPGTSSPALSDTELSKESENPVTRMITLPLRYEAEFNDGPTKGVKDTFEIDQAVLPFMLNNDWALITRTKFPAVSQPPRSSARTGQPGFPMVIRLSFYRRSTGQAFTGVSDRCFIILPPRTRRSA